MFFIANNNKVYKIRNVANKDSYTILYKNLFCHAYISINLYLKLINLQSILEYRRLYDFNY
jgi:hypothetical protein